MATQSKTPSVRHRCKHICDIARHERIDCPNCLHRQHRLEFEDEQRLKREANQTKGRLPHKSMFVLSYDDEAQQWEGSLAVAGIGVLIDRRRTFIGTVRALDREYRRIARAKDADAVRQTTTGQTTQVPADGAADAEENNQAPDGHPVVRQRAGRPAGEGLVPAEASAP